MKVSKACWARLRLLELLDHRLDGSTKKLGRRDWSIEKKALLFLLEVCQIHPQMPFRYHHGCHGPPHSSGSLLGGTEGQIRGAAQLSYFVRWQALTVIQVFQQIRLVRLEHRQSVQRSDGLTCCCISKIQGLRWQGGSLERGCLTHREISLAGYHLLHRGHPLIAIFTHPLNISITSMLKPMNTRKNGFFPLLLNLHIEIYEERKARSSWGFMARKIYFYDP